jgi:hypothetical protein
MPAAAFTALEFEVVWSALGLGRLPFPLAAPTGENDQNGENIADERGELTKAVFERLSDRGIAIGSRLRTEWAELLAVLARPARSVDAVGRIVRPLAAVAAASGDGVAALALKDRGSVLVGPIRVGSLVESVVALLPAERAGPGHQVMVPVGVVRRLLSDSETTDLGDLAGLPAEDAGLLLRLAEGRVRGGQFGVNVLAADGRLRRGIPVVSWFDTAEGRYLMTNDGSTLVVAPADAARIAVRLHEVFADVW